MRKTIAFLFFFIFAMLMFLQTAFAYVDFSAMTYIITALAAVVIAVGTAMGSYWRRFVIRYRSKNKNKRSKKVGKSDNGDDE